MLDSVTTEAGTMTDAEYHAIVGHHLSEATALMLQMGIPAEWVVAGYGLTFALAILRVVGRCDEHPSRITCHFGRLLPFFLPLFTEVPGKKTNSRKFTVANGPSGVAASPR